MGDTGPQHWPCQVGWSGASALVILTIARTDQRYQEQQNLDFYQQSLQSFPSQVRPERKTKRKTDAYITDSGEYLYRIKHRNPLGYSGRKRRQVSEAEQNILSRVPRKA